MEDGVLEWFQFVFFFLSSIISTLVSITLRKRNRKISLVFLLIFIIMLIISFEEISWGQRIFDLETTQLFEKNVQFETNIHNLEIFHNKVGVIYIAISTYATFGWIILKTNIKKSIKQFLSYFIIPPFLISYFFPLFINLLTFISFSSQDYEVTEFLMSLGIFIFFIFQYKAVKIQKAKDE
jgi:hypothetical protein